MRARAFLLATLVGCQLTAGGPEESESVSILVVRDAHVFDGERRLARRSVVVRDGVITEVAVDAAVPEGAAVIEGAGCTLLPGFIDAHTHITDERDLGQALVFGVTTELDLYTFIPPDEARDLRRRTGSQDRPDLADFRMAVTPVSCPGGLGPFFDEDIPTIVDPTEAQAFVDARIGEGADYVKIMFEDGYVWGVELPNISRELLASAVDAAHARGKLAVVHVTSHHGARAAADAGADGLAHVFADEPADEALCELAARRGMFLIATLATVQGAFDEPSGLGLASDESLTRYLPQAARDNLSRPSSSSGRERGSFDNALETVRRLHEAGVVVLAGTDVPNAGTAHGVSIHRELELLVESGLSPTEALVAATSDAADAFGLHDRGRIAPGLRADLLLVRGDPMVDILATRDIVAVVKTGVPVDREAFRASLLADDAADDSGD